MGDRILVNDDSITCRVLAAEILIERGHQVRSTKTLSAATIRQWRPDLVLMDFHFSSDPGVYTGGDLIRQLRAHSRDPIILVLYSSSDDIIALAADCGADQYIKKSWGLEEMANRVHRFLIRSPS